MGAIDPSSDRPIYKQIADDLRGQIRRGAFKPGEQLPSETTLIAEYGVAQGTVRQGLALLRSEGYIVTHQGRGVYVRPGVGNAPFSWDLQTDEGGLPVHLPMGVTVDGRGPTNDNEAHHYLCWCADPECLLNDALRLAWEAGTRVTPP